MRNLLIVGNGGHGKVVLDCARQMGVFDKIAFLTDHEAEALAGYPCFNEKDCDLGALRREYGELVVALGNNRLRLARQRYFAQLGFRLPVLVHPQAAASPLAHIGAGSVVLAQAAVNAFARVGEACILNTAAVVEHDCVLGDGVHLSPKAAIGGGTAVDEGTWLCVGVSAADHIHIGAWSIAAAGAAVVTDVADGVLVAGVPAVVKKKL